MPQDLLEILVGNPLLPTIGSWLWRCSADLTVSDESPVGYFSIQSEDGRVAVFFYGYPSNWGFKDNQQTHLSVCRAQSKIDLPSRRHW